MFNTLKPYFIYLRKEELVHQIIILILSDPFLKCFSLLIKLLECLEFFTLIYSFFLTF